MTADYGGGKRQRKGPGIALVVVVAVVLIAAFMVPTWLWRRAGDIREAQLWAIGGPPCPAVSRQAFEAQPDKVQFRFTNDEISFGRAHGHVSCNDIVNDGGRGFGRFTECQFNTPGALQVTTPAGDFYFLPQYGPATVSVKQGRPTCVRGGWFRGQG